MLLKRDIKELCNLYNLDYNEVYKQRDNYLVTMKDVIELDIIQNVLNNLIYVNAQVRTKEDYTMINVVSESEYNNIKNFDLNKLYNNGFDNLTLEEYKAQQSIIVMIIPKILIQYAEKYNENRYNNMMDRLYA